MPGVVEDVHRGVGPLELDLRGVEVLGDIAELADEDDVEVVGVVDDPLRLLVERSGPVGGIHVMLGVRDDDDGEILGRRRPRRPAVERRRERITVRDR